MIARRFFSGFLLLALAVLAACGQAGRAGTSPSAAAPPAPTSAAELHATAPAPATLAASATSAATFVPTQPASPGTEPPAVSLTPVAAGATSAPVATAPMRPAASAAPANPAARLKTAMPAPKVTPMRPRGISIYGLAAGGGRRTPAQYAADVSAAARGHLAGVLGVDQASIAVARSGPLEVAVAAPCGIGGEQPKQPSSDGLAMGYEVVLDAGGRQYRYVAVGALAYPCGESR